MIYDLRKELDAQNASIYFAQNVKAKNTIVLRRVTPPSDGKRDYTKLLHLYFSYVSIETKIPFDAVKYRIFKLGAARSIFRKNIVLNGKNIIVAKSIRSISEDELFRAFHKFRTYISTNIGLYLPDINQTQMITELEQKIKERTKDEENDSRA